LTGILPRLPDRALLADLCREAAARERVQPQLVEKDFYLTRILWALGQGVGDGLLLKGGTTRRRTACGSSTIPPNSGRKGSGSRFR
jgi:hypothetical protein